MNAKGFDMTVVPGGQRVGGVVLCVRGIRLTHGIRYKHKFLSPVKDAVWFLSGLSFTNSMRCASSLKMLSQGVVTQDRADLPAGNLGKLSVLGPIAPAIGASVLAGEVQSLRELGKCILKKAGFEAYVFSKDQAPRLLSEIGRLRELSFRAIGIGSGRSRDLDDFDATYLHLVLWDNQGLEIVGAYRLGDVPSLLACAGEAGLYTSTLFDWDAEFLEGHRNALELGRSFVVEKYQKNFWSLHLLWLALGRFITQNKTYGFLLGAVSLSGALHPVAQTIVIEFLLRKCAFGGEVRVRPKISFQAEDLSVLSQKTLPESLLEVQELIRREVDPGFKMPPLLKHYTAFGGRILGVNVDPYFQNSVDCLFVLDLSRTHSFRSKRYLEGV